MGEFNNSFSGNHQESERKSSLEQVIKQESPEVGVPSIIESQLQEILQGTEFVDQQEELLEKISLFSGEEQKLLHLLERAKFYQDSQILQDFVDFESDFMDIQNDFMKYSIESLDNQAKQYVNTFLQNENIGNILGIENYSLDIPPEELALQVSLHDIDISKLQKILHTIQTHPKVDNILHNHFTIIQKQLQEVVNNQQEVVNNQQEVVNNQQEVVTQSIKNAVDRVTVLGEEKSKPLVDKIFEHGNIQEKKELYNSGDEKQRAEILLEALTKITQDKNHQAIEDILSVAAELDTKGVNGETFQVFYEMFESSGIESVVLQNIRSRIENRTKNTEVVLKTSSSADLFPGAKNLSGEVKKDTQGNLIYQNQKLNLGEIPPALYVMTTVGNMELKGSDDRYYESLMEKNKIQDSFQQKQSELKDVEKILSGEQENLQNINQQIQLLKEKISRENIPIEEEIELRSQLQELEGQQKETQRMVNDLEQQQLSLQTEIVYMQEYLKKLENILLEQTVILERNKQRAQNTANFLDNIGFTHIPKSDIDWMLGQVNAFDATYYGFSQPLDFEAGFDYIGNKGYREFTKFFNILMYGKDVKDHALGKDFEKLIRGTDKANTSVGFQQLLKQQGVLREDGTLNKFNFFQKFRSRAEQPAQEEPVKEGVEVQ